MSEEACPIFGEYTGTIPDANGALCAKLYSDCRNPHKMFYNIYNCHNNSEIYQGIIFHYIRKIEEKLLFQTFF